MAVVAMGYRAQREQQAQGEERETEFGIDVLILQGLLGVDRQLSRFLKSHKKPPISARFVDDQ